jgi:hypothetical protein
MNTEDLIAAAEAAGLTPANFRKMSKERRAKWVEARRAELIEALPKAAPEAPKPSAEPSRQVRRQTARRAGKMPIGISALKWHRIKNFARIGRGRKNMKAMAASVQKEMG